MEKLSVIYMCVAFPVLQVPLGPSIHDSHSISIQLSARAKYIYKPDEAREKTHTAYDQNLLVKWKVTE